MPRPKNQQEFRKELAEQFANLLERDQLDWKQRWVDIGDASNPYNGVSGRRYNGINQLALALTSICEGYQDPRWVTMTQIKDTEHRYHPGQDWHLQKGSHATYVEWWYQWDTINHRQVSWKEYNDAIHSGEREPAEFALKYRLTPLFNATVVDGMPELKIEPREPRKASEMIDMLSQGMNVAISYDGGSRSYYRPSDDTVHLPVPEAFESDYDLNVTTLHELAHATGHESRLNSSVRNHFGSDDYAREELVAEITSAFMGVGLDTQATPMQIKNHEAYLQSWIQNIRDDPNVLINAIKDAQKATEYMDGVIEKEEERIAQGLPRTEIPEPIPAVAASTARDSGQVLSRAFIDDPIDARRNAENAILDFVQKEFNNEAEIMGGEKAINRGTVFSDLNRVVLARDTVADPNFKEEEAAGIDGEGKIELTAAVDLNNLRIDTYLGVGNLEMLVAGRQFDNINDLVVNGLTDMTHESLVQIDSAVVKRYSDYMRNEEFPNAENIDRQAVRVADVNTNMDLTYHAMESMRRIAENSYNRDVDFHDTSNVMIADTDSHDGILNIRTSVDLDNYRIVREVSLADDESGNAPLVVTQQFDSLRDLDETLSTLDPGDVEPLMDSLNGYLTNDMLEEAASMGIIREVPEGSSARYVFSDIDEEVAVDKPAAEVTTDDIREAFEELLNDESTVADYVYMAQHIVNQGIEPENPVSRVRIERDENPFVIENETESVVKETRQNEAAPIEPVGNADRLVKEAPDMIGFHDPDVDGTIVFAACTYRDNVNGKTENGIFARRYYIDEETKTPVYEFGLKRNDESNLTMPLNENDAYELWYSMDQNFSRQTMMSIRLNNGIAMDEFMFDSSIGNPMNQELIDRSVNSINNFLREQGRAPLTDEQLSDLSELHVIDTTMLGNDHIPMHVTVNLETPSVEQHLGDDGQFPANIISYDSLEELAEALENGLLNEPFTTMISEDVVQQYREAREAMNAVAFDEANRERLDEIHQLAVSIDGYEQTLDPERYASHGYVSEAHIAEMENALRDGNIQDPVFNDVNTDFWAGAVDLSVTAIIK